jgi:hypothetical protein
MHKTTARKGKRISRNFGAEDDDFCSEEDEGKGNAGCEWRWQ